METRTYHYRGQIERWRAGRRSYVWCDGFSAQGSTGGVEYPWMTKQECRAEARLIGARAVFKREG
jgi:hypothetical protein